MAPPTTVTLTNVIQTHVGAPINYANLTSSLKLVSSANNLVKFVPYFAEVVLNYDMVVFLDFIFLGNQICLVLMSCSYQAGVVNNPVHGAW